MIKQWISRKAKKPPITDESSDNADDDQEISSAWNLLALVNNWVKHAEAKLGVVFAFLGVIIAGFINLMTKYSNPSLLVTIVFFITVFLVLASGFSAAMGLVPRFRPKKKEGEEKEDEEANLLFYTDVFRNFEKREKDYCREVAGLLSNNAELTRQIARQVFSNSGVAFQKYKWANRAIGFGLLASVGVLTLSFAYAFEW